MAVIGEQFDGIGLQLEQRGRSTDLVEQAVFRAVNGLPGLTQLPVLGTLFRSRDFIKQESELVVIVTPYLVKPVPPGRQLKTPLDFYMVSDHAEFMGVFNQMANPDSPLSKTELAKGVTSPDANVRLQTMSAGKYELLRIDEAARKEREKLERQAAAAAAAKAAAKPAAKKAAPKK